MSSFVLLHFRIAEILRGRKWGQKYAPSPAQRLAGGAEALSSVEVLSSVKFSVPIPCELCLMSNPHWPIFVETHL